MQLTSQRLLLRQITATDIVNIHALHSLPETDEYNTLGIPGSIIETEKIVEQWLSAQVSIPRSAYTFCIEKIDTSQFIGLIALNIGKPNYSSGEVWYKTHPTQWRKGYTTEALQVLLYFCFNTLRLHRIEAGCAVENSASIKVLEHAGFIREGRKRKKLPIRGEWADNYFYAILEEDYFNIAGN